MWRDPETSGKSNRAPVPTILPSIQIFAVVGVVSSRRRPVGAAARRGAGAPSGTAVGGRGAAARVPPAESELAPRAGAGTPDGRPSNHTAPPEIGRAPGRERVQMSVGAGSLKKKNGHNPGGPQG